MKPFIDECGIIHIAYMATATFLSKEVVTTSGSLCTSNGRCCVSNIELAEEGMLSQWGGEMNLDRGIADLPHCASGKVKEGHP